MNLIELKKYDDLDYSLIYRDGVTLTPFICAWNPTYDDKGCVIRWSQGHYFNDIDSAVEYLNDLNSKSISNSAFDCYNKLTQYQKDNLRMLSTYKYVDDTLPKTFQNRDETIRNIGDKAFYLWVNYTGADDISCEDIAINIANAVIYKNVDLTDLDIAFTSLSNTQLMENVLSEFSFIDEYMEKNKNGTTK